MRATRVRDVSNVFASSAPRLRLEAAQARTPDEHPLLQRSERGDAGGERLEQPPQALGRARGRAAAAPGGVSAPGLRSPEDVGAPLAPEPPAVPVGRTGAALDWACVRGATARCCARVGVGEFESGLVATCGAAGRDTWGDREDSCGRLETCGTGPAGPTPAERRTDTCGTVTCGTVTCGTATCGGTSG